MNLGLKRFLIVFANIAAIFVLAFVSGPIIGWKPGAETPEVKFVETAIDLDKYLSDFEAQVRDVKPELARGIVWSDPTIKSKTPLAIVYIHGFSASRREMYPVWDTVAKNLGANLYFARVKAHGQKDGEAFGELTAQDFIDEGRVAMAVGRKLGEQVVLVGMSTGAEIVLQIANENRDAKDLRALILVSPNHMPANAMSKFISGPLGKLWAKNILGSHRSFKTINEAHASYWTSTYRAEAIPAMMDLVNSTGRIDLSKIKTPSLTLYTKHDKVVNVSMIEKRFTELGSEPKKLVDLPEATRHEFASEAVAPEAVDATVKIATGFLKSLEVR